MPTYGAFASLSGVEATARIYQTPRNFAQCRPSPAAHLCIADRHINYGSQVGVKLILEMRTEGCLPACRTHFARREIECTSVLYLPLLDFQGANGRDRCAVAIVAQIAGLPSDV